nr:acyltransferase [Paenibacillus sp. 1-18]
MNGTVPRFWLGDQERVTVANIVAHVLFLNGLNPYWINSIIGVEWSIAVECMFYLFVPLLFKLIRSVRHAAWFVMIVLVLSFGLGILLFFIWKNERHWKSIDRVSWGLLLVSVLFAFFAGMTDYLIGAGLLLGAYALYHWQPMWLLNRVWSWIGRLSYSMYLTHMLVLGLISQVKFPFAPTINLIMMFMITLLLTTGLSWLTYTWIEQPGIRWGKRLISRMRPIRGQGDSVKESVA